MSRGSWNGTYDGRSETAYLIAKLTLPYTLAKTPSQELAEKSWPVETAVYIQREEVGERGEEGEEGRFFFWVGGFEVSVLGISFCKSETSATIHGDPLFLT